MSCHVAAQSLPPRRVIVVLVPGLRADDLTSSSLPMLQTLRGEGAAGWMVCRAARTTNRALLRSDGRDTAASLALTLGSGSRSLAPRGERRKKEGERDTASTADWIAALTVLNASVDHAVSVGALGDMVHARGWQTAMLGDADTAGPEESGRLLAMDGQGNVDVMPMSLRPNRAAPNAPYGVRDDVDGLAQGLRRLPPRVAFVVVMFGDLARADAYAPLCLPEQSRAFRDVALRELNTLLTRLRQQPSNRMPVASSPSNSVFSSPVSLPPASAAPPSRARPMLGPRNDTNDTSDTMDGVRLLVLAPAPADSSDVTDRVAPILVWGKGIVPGVLTSPSTRLPGVVVNTDFLPSTAAALGLPMLRGVVGRPFGVLPANANALTTTAWRAQHDRLLLSEHLKDVYGGLPTGQTLLVLAAWWAWRKRHLQNGLQWTRALAAAIVALPLGMLLLPALPFAAASVGAAGMALTLWTLLFMILAGWKNADADCARSRAIMLLSVMFAALIAALILDLVTDSHLLRQAWMSYSVMETARFYGIGNEYMGAIIGAACVLLGARGQGSGVRQRVYMLLSSAFCLLLVLALGYNRFGAKVGAIPSAGCALGVCLLVLWRGRVRGRDVAGVLLASLLLLSGLAWLDARHSTGEQSHLARAVGGGLSGLAQIARRKLLLEGYLLLHSPWSAALCSASLLFGLLTRTGQKMPPEKHAGAEPIGSERTDAKMIQALVETEAIITKATAVRRRAVTTGLVAGAMASLLCNDSGVTAAALIMLFGCAWMLTE